jgi:hypothetical protein
LEQIISNLDKAKLKLDEAFFYLDEIEELIQEDGLSEDAGSKVTQATEAVCSQSAGSGVAGHPFGSGRARGTES